MSKIIYDERTRLYTRRGVLCDLRPSSDFENTNDLFEKEWRMRHLDWGQRRSGRCLKILPGNFVHGFIACSRLNGIVRRLRARPRTSSLAGSNARTSCRVVGCVLSSPFHERLQMSSTTNYAFDRFRKSRNGEWKFLLTFFIVEPESFS